MKLNARYQRHSLFSRPEWRWERVLDMCDRAPVPGRCTRHDDAFVREARAFLLRWRAYAGQPERREELFWQHGGLYHAFEIHERSDEEPEGALTVQARLLARQSSEEIAALTGLLPETVDWYEALFFGVRDRIDQRDWVTKQVLVPAAMRNMDVRDRGITLSRTDGAETPFALPFYDVTLKLFAYFGGAPLLDFMLTGFKHQQRVTDPRDVDGFLDSYLTSAVKRRAVMAAATFDVNQFNVMQLIELSARLMEIERNAELGSAAKTSIETHVLSMLNELPWIPGGATKTPLEGRLTPKRVGEFDDGSVELRDSELLAVASHDDVPSALRGLEKFELPAEVSMRRRKDDSLPPVPKKKSGD